MVHCAWLIDNEGDYAKVRQHIAGVKVATPKVLIDVVYRAMHAHGSLGVSNQMPLTSMWLSGPVMGIADGPTEVHKDTIAKQILKSYKASDGLFPSQHLPTRIAAARTYIEIPHRKRDSQPLAPRRNPPEDISQPHKAKADHNPPP